MTSLSGKAIAITGAASGIGLATAHLLASRGASLSLADIQSDALLAAVSSIKSFHPKARIYHKTINVASAPEVSTWLDETLTHLGALHGAANVAGILGTVGVKKISEMEDGDWDTVMDINLKGVFNCLRAELQRIEEGGSIVNAASASGLKGHSRAGAYCASKHGVIGLTRSAALEEGERRIRVNCIAPGPIDTPMIRNVVTSSVPSEDGMMLAMDRRGTPEEVAKLIAFLLSDESTYTTGSCYGIDGGYMA
ncbi:hypothetical protein N7G274_005855 [Stereocaulon virgatum]|uniref:Uncharacterized protein n=1 Tax=Stereocaulon virgatum TaxID=373712 RepID=A0ABR4A713_9LECA